MNPGTLCQDGSSCQKALCPVYFFLYPPEHYIFIYNAFSGKRQGFFYFPNSQIHGQLDKTNGNIIYFIHVPKYLHFLNFSGGIIHLNYVSYTELSPSNTFIYLRYFLLYHILTHGNLHSPRLFYWRFELERTIM